MNSVNIELSVWLDWLEITVSNDVINKPVQFVVQTKKKPANIVVVAINNFFKLSIPLSDLYLIQNCFNFFFLHDNQKLIKN